MNLARRSMLSVCVLLVVMMSSSVIAATQPVIVTSTTMKVTVSSNQVQVGQSVRINITVNTTEPLRSSSARIIISSLDSGSIIVTANQNLSTKQNLTLILPGRLYTLNGTYEFVPQKGIEFGDYTIWVTVGNVSAFQKVSIMPSLADFYTDFKAMERHNQQAQNNYWYVIQIVYPAAFLLSAMTIVICFYLWRLPDSSKEELKYWLLSKTDPKKLKFMQSELRDINRQGFSERNSPSVGKNEKMLVSLRKQQDTLSKLKSYTDKRIEKLNRMKENAEEFAGTLQETIDVYDIDIVKRNGDIEKALGALQIEAQRLNKKNKPEKRVRKLSPMDFERLRRLSRRREEPSEDAEEEEE